MTTILMMTPLNGTLSALLALYEGNSPVAGEFPSQRPVTRSFDVFFDLRFNKRLSKPSRRRWFVTPSSSLWHHCYVQIVHMYYISHDDRVSICEIYLFQALKLTALMKWYCANLAVLVMVFIMAAMAANPTIIILLTVRSSDRPTYLSLHLNERLH